MEGSPDKNINEDRGYKSENLSDEEAPTSKAEENDEKLEKAAKIKMFPSLKEDKFQLSVREDIPVQRGSNTKETEEQAIVQMNVSETVFEKYDLYVFTGTLMLVNGWKLDFITLHLSYKYQHNHYTI
jgi:hypothetical protein